MHVASQLFRLWVSRLLWFGVSVSLLAFLLHLPAGLRYVETGQHLEGVRVVVDYRREYSFARAMEALRRYPSDLVHDRIRIDQTARTPGFSFLPVLRHDWFNSFQLYAVGVGAGSGLGILLGLLMALRRRWLRSVSVTFSILGLSLPDFFVVMTLQFVSIWFWVHYDLKPFLVLSDPTVVPQGWVIPVVGLSLVPLGYMARLTAAAMDDVMQEEYIRTARSKGLHEAYVIYGHGLRNAIPRILAGVPALLNITLSSLPVVERFTVWPGMSKWLVVQGATVTPAMATTAAMLLVAWFVLFDGLAHTVRLIFAPGWEREVVQA